MGGLVGRRDRGRLARAGMLGFAPITLGLAILLSTLEPIVVEYLAAQFPIHRLFTLLFMPTAFLIAGVSVWVLARTLADGPLARRLFWQIGLVAAVVFVAINLSMETLGWRVGAPDAAARFTMLTVMLTGNLGAALAGGAFLGWRLHHLRRQTSPTPASA